MENQVMIELVRLLASNILGEAQVIKTDTKVMFLFLLCSIQKIQRMLRRDRTTSVRKSHLLQGTPEQIVYLCLYLSS